jgi:tol-pal system protein YbgF
MRTSRVLLCLAVLALAAHPAFPVAKEIIQLQTQVQQLQDQMTQMRQSFDERMGVMRNLIEQSTDNVNRINATINDLNKALQTQHNDVATRNDQLSGQVQALTDSLDELKGRLARISKQLEDLQAQQQNIPQQNLAPGTQPGQPGQPGTLGPGGSAPATISQAPPPDVLYNNGLRDYNAGKMDLASNEFADYLKYYGTTDLAGNAQFYIADIAFRQGNYAQAVKEYDRVLEQYPGGNKTSAAQLKKGLSLIQLGQRDAGVRELQSLIQRYPKSIEAATARDQLRKMGVGTTASKPSAARRR